MDKRITCIVCPQGCEMMVHMDDKGRILEITGHSCKRGEAYARTEVTDPRRTLTTTMRVNGGSAPLVSVKTDTPVPKGALLKCMKAVGKAMANAPVRIGDVLIADIEGTGANIVATCDVPCYNSSNGYREGDGVPGSAAPSQFKMAAV